MMQRKRLIWLGVVVAGVAVVIFGLQAVAERLRAEMVGTAAVAGLRLEVEAVTIRPWGELRIGRMAAFRPDDTEAFACQELVASWSLWDLVSGQKLPAAIKVASPRLDTRVVDGAPRELSRWRRVLKGRLRGSEMIARPRNPSAHWFI